MKICNSSDRGRRRAALAALERNVQIEIIQRLPSGSVAASSSPLAVRFVGKARTEGPFLFSGVDSCETAACFPDELELRDEPWDGRGTRNSTTLVTIVSIVSIASDQGLSYSESSLVRELFAAPSPTHSPRSERAEIFTVPDVPRACAPRACKPSLTTPCWRRVSCSSLTALTARGASP